MDHLGDDVLGPCGEDRPAVDVVEPGVIAGLAIGAEDGPQLEEAGHDRLAIALVVALGEDRLGAHDLAAVALVGELELTAVDLVELIERDVLVDVTELQLGHLRQIGSDLGDELGQARVLEREPIEELERASGVVELDDVAEREASDLVERELVQDHRRDPHPPVGEGQPVERREHGRLAPRLGDRRDAA